MTANMKSSRYLLIMALGLCLVPERGIVEHWLGWRTTAWYAVIACIMFHNGIRRMGARPGLCGMDVCYLSLSVLWGAVAALQGGLRGALAPQDICLGAFAIYWLGRFVGESAEAVRRGMGLTVGVYAAACAAMALLEGVDATFGNRNFLACVLGLSVLAAMGPAMNESETWLRRSLLVILAVVGTYALALGSRAAAIPLVLGAAVLLWLRHGRNMALQVHLWCRDWLFKACMVLMGIVGVMAVAAMLLMARPHSVFGRVLVWRVTTEMVQQHPWFGVGRGCFGREYNTALAEYIATGNVPVVLRINASGSYHALNEPLEHLAEMGLIGFLPYVVFLGFAAYHVWTGLRRGWRERGSTGLVGTGMACVVLMMMACMLFSFPSKVAPCTVLAAGALGILVTLNTREAEGQCAPSGMASALTRVFWLGGGILHVVACVACLRMSMAVMDWHEAECERSSGRVEKSLERYKGMMPVLGWNGRFLSDYGDALSQYGTAAGSTGADWSTSCAIGLYEKAKQVHPDPYMAEHLALAYLRLSAGTNWPMTVQTRYAPYRLLGRKSEPPPGRLSRADCIDRAINNLVFASNVMPWRLTPKFYLAEVYRQIGDTNNVVKYARLVVDTPMKKYTEEGVGFKEQARKMLGEMGVPCKSAGVVVFDIWDRKTWNEGRW